MTGVENTGICSAPGPRWGMLGAPPPDTSYRLALHALAMCPSQTQFLDPPLIHSFIHIRVRQVDNRNYTMIKSINIKSYKSNLSLTDYGVKYVKVE